MIEGLLEWAEASAENLNMISDLLGWVSWKMIFTGILCGYLWFLVFDLIDVSKIRMLIKDRKIRREYYAACKRFGFDPTKMIYCMMRDRLDNLERWGEEVAPHD